jgi:hypothetical protein
MAETRWLRLLGRGIVALVAVLGVASTTVGAATRPWTPGACLTGPTDLVGAAREVTPRVPTELMATAWFRLDPVAGDDGSLAGQHLVLGRFGDPATRSLDLPAESFAAGPFGGIVLVGSDDGATSRLEAVDVASGCAWLLGTDRDVIRRATMDPSGTAVYEMRVARDTRADLGIWRRRIDTAGPTERFLAPISPDARFGRTFSTEFMWDTAGQRLAIQSCGEIACRTRLVTPDGGQTRTIDDPDLGLLVGVDGDQVVTYAACTGLPCQIVSSDATTREERVLADAAGFATLIHGSAGTMLVHERGPDPAAGITTVPLGGGPSVRLAAIPNGGRLVAPSFGAGSAARLPADWILLTADGRSPIDPADRRPLLRHLTDGLTVPLDEAIR